MNPLDWTGLAASIAVLAAYALGAAVRALYRRRYRLDELADLDRDDIDPHWEQVRKTLVSPPEHRKQET